jgi:hypothetical protein
MLPFVTIGKQMSVMLDMNSHGLLRVQMSVTTFLPSHLASFLVDFGRHVMQHIFSSPLAPPQGRPYFSKSCGLISISLLYVKATTT